MSIEGNSLTCDKYSLGFIYVVRDPRDVVISYSKYQNISIDRAIEKITNKTFIEYSGSKRAINFPH